MYVQFQEIFASFKSWGQAKKLRFLFDLVFMRWNQNGVGKVQLIHFGDTVRSKYEGMSFLDPEFFVCLFDPGILARLEAYKAITNVYTIAGLLIFCQKNLRYFFFT